MSLKKTLTTGALGLGLLVGTAGCDGFLDVNTDPNAATEVAGSLLFPAVIADIGSTRAIEVNPGTSIIAQQWASNGSAGVFSSPERYNISAFTSGNFWRSNYTGALKNLSLLIGQSEGEDVAQPRPNEAGQAKIFQAQVYYQLTVIFGDIPFSQAVNAAEFPNPEFDDQEAVLRGILDLVDEGVAQLDESDPNRIDTGDVLYGGDLGRWRALGNSIKLKSLMLLRGGGANVDAEIEALIASDALIRTNGASAIIPFNDATPNPVARLVELFPFYYNFFSAGRPLVDLMNDLDDPRRPAFFELTVTPSLGEAEADCPNVENEVYVGVRAGTTIRPRCQSAYVSRNFSQNATGERLVTADEVLLLEAEFLAAKGQLAAADAKYREGIRANFEYTRAQGSAGSEIAPSAVETYLATLPSLSSMSSSEAVAAVVEQHYIATYARGIDGWTLIRRTGDVGRIDRPLPSQATLTDFIARFPYPEANELTANPNSAAQPPLIAPMYFMQNAN